MILMCNDCGGALEIQSQSYQHDDDGRITGEGTAFESYKCASCGATGTYRFGDGPERMTGCVTAEVRT